MTATGTAGRFAAVERDRAALDPQGFPVDEGVGDLPACRLDNPAEGLPRNIHPGCSLLLIQTFEIGQPQRLVFVEVQEHLLEA